jgi:anti-sigma regulatory factor (Ser/Thr protein kinase)
VRDISLHILDIAENSINAGAKIISIKILEEKKKNLLTVEITDDGKGMNKEFAENSGSPFVTTRTARKVGLGLPLLKAAAEIANGRLTIKSAPGKGTKITAEFQLDHVDRKPVGSMAKTILALAANNPETHIKYIRKQNGKKFIFDSGIFGSITDEGDFDVSTRLLDIKKYLKENSII